MNENNIKSRLSKMWGIVLSILGILLVAVVFSGCVNLKYFDPQWYEFKSLIKNESGAYVYDDKLYQVLVSEQENADRANISEEDIKMPNGYKLLHKYTIQKFSDRLHKESSLFYYIDSQNRECKILDTISFSYIAHGLWLKGDEGRGFRFETKEYYSDIMVWREFHMDENGKWIEKVHSLSRFFTPKS